MPCPETNPCDPCQDTNGCYDNCGCINPTTFECITEPGTLSALNVTNDMNGKEVLQAINDVIQDLVVTPPAPGSDIYTKVSATDTTAGYLSNKIFVANSLSQSVLNPSANEKLRLAVNIPNIISADSGNLIDLGVDGKLRVLTSSTPAEVYLEEETPGSVSLTLGENEYFVLGDNRDSSFDSRRFGAIQKDVIVGRVWFRGWPFSRLSTFSLPEYTSESTVSTQNS